MSMKQVLSHIEKHENGCWVWNGFVEKKPTGLIPILKVSKPKYTTVSARRHSYEQHNQITVPPDFVVTAVCKNSLCVNPAHLIALKRGTQGHRLIGSWKFEHCQHGHEFSEWNTGRQNSGKRFCIACDKNQGKRYMAERRIEFPLLDKELRDKRIVALYIWVDSLKTKCINCDETDPVMLDFHHRDPSTKVTTISNAVRKQWSRDKIETEIAKCDLQCVRCHRKYHTVNDWVNRNKASNLIEEGKVSYPL